MLANVATIMIRPRETMRRILETPERFWPVLVVLFSMSALLGDTDRGGFTNLNRVAEAQGFPVVALLAGVLLGTIVASFIAFYLFAWAGWGIGRALEGKGTPAEVRRAMAWGLTPGVWALLYRVPAALLWTPPAKAEMSASSERLVLNPGRMGDGCLMGIIFSLLEVAAFFWCAAVLSNTIAEAHRFSGRRGLATVILTSIAPLVLVIAAVLAM